MLDRYIPPNGPIGSIQGRAVTLDITTCCGHDVIGPVVSLDAWHHTAFVFDGTSLILYLDGKGVAVKDLPAALLFMAMTIL